MLIMHHLYCPHFSDEEIETWRSKLPNFTEYMEESGLEPKLV